MLRPRDDCNRCGLGVVGGRDLDGIMTDLMKK